MLTRQLGLPSRENIQLSENSSWTAAVRTGEAGEDAVALSDVATNT